MPGGSGFALPFPSHLQYTGGRCGCVSYIAHSFMFSSLPVVFPLQLHPLVISFYYLLLYSLSFRYSSSVAFQCSYVFLSLAFTITQPSVVFPFFQPHFSCYFSIQLQPPVAFSFQLHPPFAFPLNLYPPAAFPLQLHPPVGSSPATTSSNYYCIHVIIPPCCISSPATFSCCFSSHNLFSLLLLSSCCYPSLNPFLPPSLNPSLPL